MSDALSLRLRAPAGRWQPRVRVLLLPGAIYGERINVTDLRVAKVLRFKNKRLNVGLDLYNLFNANKPTTFETVYDVATNGARWLQPTAVLTPRATRFNVQFDF